MSRQPSLLEVAVSNVGLIKGGRVMVYLAAWAVAMERDDFPEDDDARGALSARVLIFTDVLAVRERSAWRAVEMFRKAFPGETDPTRLVRLIQAEARSRKLDAGTIGLTLYPGAPS